MVSQRLRSPAFNPPSKRTPHVKTLNIGADGFTLPLELVTSTQAILARKRSGKSYTASVEAEELLQQHQQIAVIDPTSAWWGLRSSSDGEGDGYPVVVFGGGHADAPLDFRAGRAMALALVEHGFSAIFDIGDLRTEEQVQFVMEFSSELLRINRNALHVFMDEADTFAPQKPLGLLQNKCLGTVSRLVKQGGIRGVGFTMITQRPASINKDVLSQVDILTVLRMSHPLDIKAATDWIKSEVTVDFAREVEKDLPGLPVGTAYFCSASLGLGERVAVRRRRTFNSGATPKPGERKIEPKVMAKIDIEKLGKEISASVERSKEDSPEYLKEKIRTLEAELGMGVIEDIQAQQEELERLRTQCAVIPELEDKLRQLEQTVNEGCDAIALALDRMRSGSQTPPPRVSAVLPSASHGNRASLDTLPPSRSPALPLDSGDINEPQQRILNAIATLAASRAGSVSLEWIACTAGSTPRARGFEENLRQLKAKGYVSGIQLTAAGAAIATASSTPPTFEAMLWRLRVMLSQPQIAILEVLKLGPLPPEILAADMGTTSRSRGFEENIRQLRKREYVVSSQGNCALTPWLERLR